MFPASKYIDPNAPDEKALVVLSGGQDSVTCLAWALHHFAEVEAITFAYGQRHSVELQCARAVCREMGVSHKVVDMTFFGEMSVSALTGSGAVSAAHELRSDLPASFVPNRNAMFTTAAHAWAQTIRAQHLVLGVCQTDYSGYPDCREVFVDAIGSALNLGAAVTVQVHAPLMHLDKAETFVLADELGALETVVEMSHTCYEGERDVRHAWGYGCGVCPACELRRNGWEQFKEITTVPEVV